MLRFNKSSFFVFSLLFIVEIFIALYIHDSVIRPYFGDALVVILIYYFIKTFFRIQAKVNIIAVTSFAFVIEISQYFKLIYWLGLEHNKGWRIILGTSFNWLDFVSYLFGAFILYIIEINQTFKRKR